jgi:hypothetical protein
VVSVNKRHMTKLEKYIGRDPFKSKRNKYPRKLKDLREKFIVKRCDNLIPGMAAVCRLGIVSGKLMQLSTFGHVPTCVYMSYSPNEQFAPKQQRKQCVSAVYCW